MKIGVWLIIAAILGGCVQPIPPENLVPSNTADEYAISQGPLYRSIAIGKVGGGSETNPLMFSEIGSGELESAILSSLKANHFDAEDVRHPPYLLDVFLIEIDRPHGGAFTTTVTVFVRYKLTRLNDKKVVLDEIIKTSDTKTVNDIFVGLTRLKVTQETAMQKNIAEFLKMASALNRQL